MRRFLAGSLTLVAFTATFLVLPVYAEPGPEAVPVEVTAEEVSLGSVEEPEGEAEVREGTTEPVAGVADTAPTLTVSRTDVDEFSMVGVNWAYDPAVTDTVIQVRVQDAGGEWGEWTEVGVEDAAPNVGAEVSEGWRGSATPLWTGPSTGVEVELVTRSGAAPTDVQLDLIDPGASAADSSLSTPEIQDTADATMAMPDVYSRAQWGADERLRTWAPQYAPTIKAATLHHTASSNNYTADQVPAILRGFYYLHAVSNGWGDIGYNVLVDKFGRRWEGRHGGLASTVIGAHAGGFNTGTFGVSMIGNYDVVGTPQVMIDSVEAIIAWKFSLYNVDPRGTATVSGRVLPTIHGHRDTKATACPGRYGYARLPEIRGEVARALSGMQPTISARYSADPWFRLALGGKIGTEKVTAGVTWQQYERAYAYWTAATGAHVVSGQIWGVYMDAGGPAVLGAPTTDELATPDGVGRFNHFARDASIYWTPSTGAQLVKGQIRASWSRTGWETGPLGYPTAGERAGHGGRYSTFEDGTIFWTPAGGAVAVQGAISRRWNQLGGLSWAVPTGSERAVGTGANAGAYSTFAGNRAVYWSEATGAHAVEGQIRDRWTAAGGATGVLGFPTSDEQAGPAGSRYSLFESGGVYWTPEGGPRVVQGAIHRRWLALGGLTGSGFGVPTTEELTTPDGIGRFTEFSNYSSIYWTPVTGARAVQGQIRDRWAALGWERSPLGYPTADERATSDGRGRFSAFQNGAVYWTPAGGPQAVYGAIHQRWLALGGVTSSLGHPTSSEYAVPGGRATDFEHGRITWTAATGALRVTTR